MKKWIPIVMIFMYSVLFSATPEEMFKEGIRLYDQKDYEAALQHFLQIETSGKISGELLYNIGNCYYRLGQKGLAIYYYEKARLLLPDDEDLEYNLKLVRSEIPGIIQIPEKFFLLEWYNRFLEWIPFTTLLALLLMIFLIFNMLFLLSYLFETSIIPVLFKRIRWFLVGVGVVLSILVWIDYRNDYGHDYGVIVRNMVQVYNEPVEGGTPLYVIYEGQKAELLRTTEEWTEILLPDGNKGWINSHAIRSLKE